MISTSTLELHIQFLLEKRTEPYIPYGKGASQRKIVYGAKNTSGATRIAGWQAGVVGRLK